MLPKKVEAVLTPVAVSGTHIGFSTLRMEPCWMALGQAAGVAAARSVQSGIALRQLDVSILVVVIVELHERRECTFGGDHDPSTFLEL